MSKNTCRHGFGVMRQPIRRCPATQSPIVVTGEIYISQYLGRRLRILKGRQKPEVERSDTPG
jgi:hypothetical protein